MRWVPRKGVAYTEVTSKLNTGQVTKVPKMFQALRQDFGDTDTLLPSTDLTI